MKTTPLIRTLAGAALLAGSLFAQSDDGSYWNEYPAPANVTNVRGLGTTVLLETPTEYHFYSGLHRKWLVHPVTAPSIVGFANRHCVWTDGSSVFGYSSMSHQVAELPTAGPVTVSIGSATSSWTAFVIDGSTVWGWSAFFGEWQPLPVSSAPQMGIGSHMLSCDDGAQISAFSAFYGEWVSIPNTGATQLTTWRNGAIATFSAPDTVKSFSAYTNDWQSTPFPTSNVSINAQDAVATVADGSNSSVLFVSSLHNEFLPTFWPAGTTLNTTKSCSIVTTPSGAIWGYAPSTSTLTPIPTFAPATVSLSAGSFGGIAVIDDGVTLQAFSGFTGTVAAAPFYVPTTLTTGDVVALAEGPGGINFCYSGLLGTWTTGPATVSTGLHYNYESIIRVVPGGYEAFSARTGTFATLASGGGNVVGLTNGSIVGVQDSNGIDVFDPRYCRWDHVATGNNPTFGVHRLVGIGQDGASAFGYSLWLHGWETVPLQGTVTAVNVNSSIGFVTTTSHYYVYTANGSFGTFARFPEFSRFHALGAPISHVNAGNPGAFVFAGLALQGADLPTPFGRLRIDPSATLLALGLVPPSGVLYTPIPTPDEPALRGIELFMQDVLLRPTGEIALTNGHDHYLW